ncbi:hypothetical protein H5410_008285 [Solanum commersonii]|uniref:Uncharacterized protein n=1 Tax=Solanum commersonii TaxID=4109 RepID=A0A9J6AFB4_SOLCO|nr:hypothetical protein H5410_008285 [Solanum commersonii]
MRIKDEMNMVNVVEYPSEYQFTYKKAYVKFIWRIYLLLRLNVLLRELREEGFTSRSDRHHLRYAGSSRSSCELWLGGVEELFF